MRQLQYDNVFPLSFPSKIFSPHSRPSSAIIFQPVVTGCVRYDGVKYAPFCRWKWYYTFWSAVNHRINYSVATGEGALVGLYENDKVVHKNGFFFNKDALTKRFDSVLAPSRRKLKKTKHLYQRKSSSFILNITVKGMPLCVIWWFYLERLTSLFWE